MKRTQNVSAQLGDQIDKPVTFGADEPKFPPSKRVPQAAAACPSFRQSFGKIVSTGSY
jgi:hypothetical protein